MGRKKRRKTADSVRTTKMLRRASCPTGPSPLARRLASARSPVSTPPRMPTLRPRNSGRTSKSTLSSSSTLQLLLPMARRPKRKKKRRRKRKLPSEEAKHERWRAHSHTVTHQHDGLGINSNIMLREKEREERKTTAPRVEKEK